MAKQNERGVIAETYQELQGLGVLQKARDSVPLPPALICQHHEMRASVRKTALLNLSDLLSRAVDDLVHDRIGPASVKMSWASGFHRILSWLSTLPHVLPGPSRCHVRDVSRNIRVSDSPAFKEFMANLVRFDNEFRFATSRHPTFPIDAIQARSTDDATLRLVKAILKCNHEATLWEENLSELGCSGETAAFDQFVSSTLIREAVFQPTLAGDTYFTQFRRSTRSPRPFVPKSPISWKRRLSKFDTIA